MPSWKKLITSGSDAALSSLTLTTGSLALDVRGGVTRLSGSTTVTGSVNIRNGSLIVSNSLDTANRALIQNNGQTVVNWAGGQLLKFDGTQTVDWEYSVLTVGAANPKLNWGSSLLQIGSLTSSLDWGQRKLLADAASTVSEWSNNIITNAGSPSTYQWRRNSTYPFSVGYDLETFNTISLEDNIITTAGKININLEPETPVPVINAMSNYGNNINLIEKSYMKIDYVISDTDPISTPPSWLRVGYLEIFSNRINSPTLAYSSSIKTDFGTVPDIIYSNTDTEANWTNNTEIYLVNNDGESQNIILKYNIWAM